jgi:putative hydrolase of the HAD superfamily
MNPPPLTFLFDIGKVLLDFDFESSLRPLAPPGVRDPREAVAPLMARKDAFERGDLGLDAFVAEALGRLGPGVDRAGFLRAWRGIFTPNLPMWEVVGRLAADGHRLLLFSNINPIHWPWLAEEFAVFRHFEAGTYSFEAGAIKPEPAIYHQAIRSHRLDPAATRYIDDLAANIGTGRDLGFRCHHYDLRDHGAFECWLEAELAAGIPR